MRREFTKEDVDLFADRLLIGLKPEENAMVLAEMSDIDMDIDTHINKIPGIKDVEPMSWCLERVIDSLREDVVEESVPIEDLLANSDDTTDREISVIRVVGE